MGTPARTETDERCEERERLLSELTQCGRRLTNLLDEQLVALKSSAINFPDFAEKIRMAKKAEIEAYRAYYGHVHRHGCV